MSDDHTCDSLRYFTLPEVVAIMRARNGRRSLWPHIGTFDDVMRIRYLTGNHIAVTFTPRCPRCKKMKHPHVTRAGRRCWEPDGRHCNRCKVRWTGTWTPFIASYGQSLRRVVNEMIAKGGIGE